MLYVSDQSWFSSGFQELQCFSDGQCVSCYLCSDKFAELPQQKAIRTDIWPAVPLRSYRGPSGNYFLCVPRFLTTWTKSLSAAVLPEVWVYKRSWRVRGNEPRLLTKTSWIRSNIGSQHGSQCKMRELTLSREIFFDVLRWGVRAINSN